MAVKIKNMTKAPVLLRFNSGLTRRFGVDEPLENISESEVRDNGKLQRLQDRNIIHIEWPKTVNENLIPDGANKNKTVLKNKESSSLTSKGGK